jgi:hypothetical protein
MRQRQISPINLLLIIRDHTANDFESLCKKFGLNTPTSTYLLREALDELRNAGLINFYDEHSEHILEGEIEISPRWEKIQTALGISLAKLAEFEPTENMAIKPLFGLPTTPTTKSDIFVLMPFTQELKPVYQDHIIKVTQSLDLKITRADDFFSTHAIMSDIWNAICDARLIIADCTSRNPNVFYEIGLAHTVGKCVVLITQNKDDVPFDLRHLRFIEYEYTPRGMIDFEKRLIETIKQELMI